MMRPRLLSLNISVCFSQLRLAKWKICLTSLKHLLPKLLLVRPRYCCAHWIVSKLPVGNSKNSDCHRLRQWFSVLTNCWENAGLYFTARLIEGVCNKRHVSGNFLTCLSPDSTERIGQSGFFCAPRSNWQKTPRSCSKNRGRTFPISTFAGLARGKKSVAKPNPCRERQRTPRSPIRFSAKWKCAEARKRQSASIF